jgi:hypothetical protein
LHDGLFARGEGRGRTIYTLDATKLSDSKVANTFYERKLKIAADSELKTMPRLLDLSEERK